MLFSRKKVWHNGVEKRVQYKSQPTLAGSRRHETQTHTQTQRERENTEETATSIRVRRRHQHRKWTGDCDCHGVTVWRLWRRKQTTLTPHAWHDNDNHNDSDNGDEKGNDDDDWEGGEGTRIRLPTISIDLINQNVHVHVQYQLHTPVTSERVSRYLDRQLSTKRFDSWLDLNEWMDKSTTKLIGKEQH